MNFYEDDELGERGMRRENEIKYKIRGLVKRNSKRLDHQKIENHQRKSLI